MGSEAPKLMSSFQPAGKRKKVKKTLSIIQKNISWKRHTVARDAGKCNLYFRKSYIQLKLKNGESRYQDK